MLDLLFATLGGCAIGSAVGLFAVGTIRGKRISDVEGEVGSLSSRIGRLETRFNGDIGRSTQHAMRGEYEALAAELPALVDRLRKGEKIDDLIKETMVKNPNVARIFIKKALSGAL